MDQSERPFVLHALRHRVAVIEAQGAGRPTERALALGVATLDRALGGGIALGTLHEIAPAAPLDFGAAASFALALLARASATDGRAVLWIEPEAAEFEAGHLHGPGLELLGLPMARLIGLSAPHERDGAWAMEEALRCRAVAGVVGEFARKSSLDLTMLRRLSLAAGEGGGLGLLLRHRACALPSPAIARCEIAATPGARDAFGGLGRPAFSLSLSSETAAGPRAGGSCPGITMSTPSSPPRHLSIWLRRLPTDRLARRASAPDESAPVVVVHMIKSALRIAAMNDAAARLRLTVGTALADARARHPALQVAQSDPAADWRLLQAVADWCDRYTPLVGIDAPSGVMLDVTGCTHLFGGETALCRDIVTRLAAQGLRARVAVASTPGCAWGVARYGFWSTMPVIPGEPEGRGPESTTPVGEYGFRARGRAPAPRNDENQHLFIVPPGAMRDALAPLPLAALRLDPETVAALADVGLDRIADVLDLPRSVLAARFDAAFLRRLDQALGREDEPITPRRPAPSFMAEQHFAEPIARERDVLGTIARLSIRLGYAMETRGEGARLLEAALFRTDGKVHRIAVGTGAPLREAERMTRLFKDRLATVGEACDPGFGYDLVRLSAPVTERCDPVQAGLAASHPAADQAAELGHLIDRLGARFGLRRVTRLAPQDTHIPEFAVAAVPAHAAPLSS
ncbi:MAG: Y-family DNA polymerase, partial [Rhodoplanes sp.]